MSWSWRPYVSVAQRHAQAQAALSKMRKRGVTIEPVEIQGRQIARSFWGRSWCEHLEKFSDFENRLPRGRTYVRNGSVCHLEIHPGRIVAKVSGSSVYDVTVKIKALPKPAWTRVCECCAGGVGSLLELLQGRLSDEVMRVVTDRDQGLFPRPTEISMDCSCPDWAGMCKHVAAALYGVGARLDEKPELLFRLRGVNHDDLISKAGVVGIVKKSSTMDRKNLGVDQLADVFGIDLAPDSGAAAASDGSNESAAGGRTRTTVRTSPHASRSAVRPAAAGRGGAPSAAKAVSKSTGAAAAKRGAKTRKATAKRSRSK